jgi:hypothetical protein
MEIDLGRLREWYEFTTSPFFDVLINAFRSFSDGDGGELNGSENTPGKMQPIHSSIA